MCLRRQGVYFSSWMCYKHIMTKELDPKERRAVIQTLRKQERKLREIRKQAVREDRQGRKSSYAA